MFGRSNKPKVPKVPEVEGLWGRIQLRLDKKIDWTYEYRFGLLDVPTFIPMARKIKDAASPWKPKRTSTSTLMLTAKIDWIEIVDPEIQDRESTLYDCKGQRCRIEVREINPSEVDYTQGIGGGSQDGSDLSILISQTADEINKLLTVTALTEHADHAHILFGIEQVPTDKKCSIPELINRFAVNYLTINSYTDE